MTKNDFEKYHVSNGENSLALQSYVKSTQNLVSLNDGTLIDVYAKMLNDRIIFITDAFDSYTANIVKSQLLYLNSVSDAPIDIYIDSPGGDVYTTFGILDTMDYIKSDTYTLNIGLAASMGAVLLTYGKEGHRRSFKRSRTMIHQPLGYSGYKQATDITITAEQINVVKSELYDILANRSGQDLQKIITDCERDYWMTAKQTLDYGLIDKVI